jgi:hypothetical protein
MRARGTSRILASLLVIAAIAGLSLTGSATTAAVKTTAGHVLQGVLTGLGPMLRLEDPTPHAAPAAPFAIPLDSIRQVWVDFPRVIIETADHVIVGPYSAFAGIAQLLKIGEGSSATELPFSAVQAIALNGASFQPIPREWQGRGWLSQIPGVVSKATGAAPPIAPAAAPTVTSIVPVVTLPTTTAAETEIEVEAQEGVSTDATPEVQPAASSGGFPWWIGLVIVAGLYAVFVLLP